jgi:hypothetical protein
VGATTIAKYMPQHRDPERAQCWRTFVQNHMPVTAACDFFVVLSHDRRRIVHIAVTSHPTAEWTARQMVEAFPGNGSEPRYLIRDRDAIYGDAFQRQVRALGIHQVRTHRSLDGNEPVLRQREQTPVREVVAEPVLGGLHHRYRRAA